MNYHVVSGMLAVFDDGLKYRKKFELHDWKWLTMSKQYNRVTTKSIYILAIYIYIYKT